MQTDWMTLARSGLVYNAPLSRARAGRLVDAVVAVAPDRVLDLGCGGGELLLQVVAATRSSSGLGVDLDGDELGRARDRALELGISDRCTFVRADVASDSDWGGGRADAVIASGVSHAFGGCRPMLSSVRDRLAVGRIAVIGEAVSSAPSTAAARDLLGELPSVQDVLSAVRETTRMDVVSAELASGEEWDAFEAGFRRRLEQSDDPELRAIADRRRVEYEGIYRGVAGYLWLVARG